MPLSKPSKKGHIRAGSLIESVMAITLITICLLIALKLHATILDKSVLLDGSRKLVVLNQLVSDMKINKNYNDKVFDFETYTIQKNVSQYENNDNLLKVVFTIKERSSSKSYSYLILK